MKLFGLIPICGTRTPVVVDKLSSTLAAVRASQRRRVSSWRPSLLSIPEDDVVESIAVEETTRRNSGGGEVRAARGWRKILKEVSSSKPKDPSKLHRVRRRRISLSISLSSIPFAAAPF